MKRAYLKLQQVFGKHALYHQPANCWLKMVPGKADNPTADTGWAPDVSFLGEGSPEIKSIHLVDLALTSSNEGVLFHELGHIFLQGGTLLSVKDTEGPMFMFQDLYYPKAQYQSGWKFTALEFENPHAKAALQIGLDHDRWDKIHGGGRRGKIKGHATFLWSQAFRKWHNRHPRFFARLYQEIARQRRSGRVSFSRQEMIDLGESIQTGYRAWHDSIKVFEGIQDGKVFGAFRVQEGKYQHVLYYNLKTVSRKFPDPAKVEVLINQKPTLRLTATGRRIFRSSRIKVAGVQGVAYRYHHQQLFLQIGDQITTVK